MWGRRRKQRTGQSVGLKKEETAYGTIERYGKCGLKEGGNSVRDKVEGRNRDMESVGLKKKDSVRDKVEGRNRDIESVGLKKEETAYRTKSVGLKKKETAYGTKWKDVIGKCGLKEGGNSVQDKVEGRNRDME